MSRLQSIWFKTTDGWSSEMCRQWLNFHNLYPIKRAHKIGNQLRYRLLNPRLFNRFTTQKIISDGRPIYLVLGWND
jgi:hypothetical protein